MHLLCDKMWMGHKNDLIGELKSLLVQVNVQFVLWAVTMVTIYIKINHGSVSEENMSRVMRKQTFWFPTWSDTNQAVQLQKIARGFKFRGIVLSM